MENQLSNVPAKYCMKKKKLIILLSFTAAMTDANAAGLEASAPMWLRDARISPDGNEIVFTYKGDIFTVPTSGGSARRITSAASYECNPVWSPDGKTLAFASDRHGNFDIFTVDAHRPGTWKRLTFDSASEIPETFTPDGRRVMYSAAIQDPASSALYPSGRMTEVYAVSIDGGSPEQILATPARYISWSPDGKSFLYQDVKGFEDEWRKHHTSSVTRDIWLYEPATGRHTQLTHRPGENLNPVWGKDGKEIYYLSERDGDSSINVYRASISEADKAEAVTRLATHPVRFLSRATDGRMAFAYDGELYTIASGARKPEKVKIELNADFPSETRKLSATSGGKNAVASPDGKSIAFIYRGDVYVTPVDYRTTKQISDTPEAERDLSWASDSALIYTSERDGRFNIYKATVARSDEGHDFAHATIINEEALFKADKHERSAAKMSPDGKQLAFILNRNKLAVMDMKSRKVRMLTDGSTYRQRDGGFSYSWSPDSRWIALEIVDRKHDPYTDIALINVADGSLTNITNSGYFDAMPRWTPDGKAISFVSERYGMRNHASWGSQMDVMLAFLNDDAYRRYRMSKEETELLKEQEKKDKNSDKKDSDSDKPLDIDVEGIADRLVRVTPMSVDMLDHIVDADGETLYFISEAEGGEASYLWEYDMREKELEMTKRMTDSHAGFDASADGKTIFVFGESLKKMSSGGGLKNITYNARKTLDPAAERRYMFDNAEREERERFYRTDMHGVNWKKLSDSYRRFLPHINNNYDFAELLSEWLGELNVSHTGGRFRGTSPTSAAERTARLGAILDMNYTGKGVRIEEVLSKGPLDGKVVAGSIIEEIDGEEIGSDTPLSVLLADRSGVATLLSVRTPDGTHAEVTVRPVSAGAESALLYDRWVRRRAADVDSLSNGRLGYVHISSMDDASFRKVYSDLMGKYNDREGVVIDIRWNGGGRLHEDIEVLFSGEKYFTQEVRGEATCDMPSRRWNKPSVMLMAEACYSNAHGTPWVYKHRGIGKLVGMPVPGTMTSVNWVTMQDPTLVFGIPVVGYRLPDGGFLENRQLEPDIKVANTPEAIVHGEDLQLRAAVNELLREIDSRKK